MLAPSENPQKPVVIDSPSGPIFGWYHAASAAVETGEGVVLCNPLGYEAVCSHRAYRELAARLAAAGYPSLRFDYHGTGDSGGDDRDPRRVEAMLAGIKSAASALKSLSGAGEISLFGVRMGATLAMHAAAEIGGVKNLIAWAPCVKGKAYLREMKAFRRMAEKDPERGREHSARAEGDEEAGGFLMTKETVAALSRLDLLELKSAPARGILLLPREGAKEDSALVAGLRRSGCDVCEEEASGYDAMMIHPHASIVPDQAFGAILRWLSKRSGGEPKSASHGGDIPTAGFMRIQADGNSALEEHPAYFGDGLNLFGIVSENGDKARRSKTAVIFLNAGHVPRSGPNRFYTRFARRWAALGITCLRVDLTGLGDSWGEGSADELMFSETTVRDVEAAMDFLRSTRSLERFVLVGLCSGAYTAFHAGLRSQAVVGEILVNPPTFYLRAGDYSINNYNEALHYKRAFFRKESWGRALRGQVDFRRIALVMAERARKSAKEALNGISALVRGRSESQDDLLAAFRGMANRGINTLLVFSPREEGFRYVEERLGSRAEKVPGSSVKVEIVEGADHTFTPLWSQDRLCALLTDHVARFLDA